MNLYFLIGASRTALAPFAFALLLMAAGVPASATDDPDRVHSLLAGMSKAVRELDYRGLFTYEYGGALETLRIVHAVRDGVEYERLQHLSGPEREVLRQGQPVDCLHTGDQLLQGRFPALMDDTSRLDGYYHFYIRGSERVAGREVIVLQVVPKDEYRYGYTLGIDKETGLLLKSLLVGKKKRVLERFQFVELELGPLIGEADYQPVSPRHRVADSQLSGCNLQEQQRTPERWQAAWLPSGFIFSGQRQSESAGDMLMYTDGLTTFSVFIELIKGQVALEGRAQRGATVAYMSQLQSAQDAYRVTVVGEIPPLTAQRVAASIRSLPSAYSSH